MADILFNVQTFRAQFPELAGNASPQGFWDSAVALISNKQYCGMLSCNARERSLYLLTAHLMSLSSQIAAGNTPGMVNSATIDKVSVSLTPPPATTQWQWWLSLTPYGAQLYALLQLKSVGGLYIGGLPEGSAFRKVGGVF